MVVVVVVPVEVPTDIRVSSAPLLTPQLDRVVELTRDVC